MMTRCPRGQAIVEFALLVPVLILLVFGIVDLGRAVYAMNAVGNAAREGTRTAIVNQTVSTIRSQAANQATALGIDATATGCTVGTPAVPATPTGPSGICVEFWNKTITATCTPSTGALHCYAVTTVKYTFSAATPVIGRIIGPFAITSTSKQQIESECIDPQTPACPVP
jgi:Flp pilus assembly protein TadG